MPTIKGFRKRNYCPYCNKYYVVAVDDRCTECGSNLVPYERLKDGERKPKKPGLISALGPPFRQDFAELIKVLQ